MNRPKKERKRRGGRPATHGTYQLERELRGRMDQRTGKAAKRNQIADWIAEANGGWAAMGNDQAIQTWVTTDLIMVVNHAFEHVYKQPHLIGKDGDLIPPLGKQLLAWMNAIPRHLMAIRELTVEQKSDRPMLDQYLAQRDAEADAKNAAGQQVDTPNNSVIDETTPPTPHNEEED